MNQRLKRFLRGFTDSGLPKDSNAWTEEDWRDLYEALETATKKIAARHRHAFDGTYPDPKRTATIAGGNWPNQEGES